MTKTSTPNSTLTLHDKLIDIQQNLKVPKLRENDFGGYAYRNVEDIEIALKPFLVKHRLTFFFTDEMVAVGDRVYCKANAILQDGDNQITVSAYAREAEKPKAKTDDAQLTGGCSSYCRKYAAQGLFLIDDGKGDPDNPKDSLGDPVESLSKAKAKLFKTFKEGGIEDSMDIMANIQQALGKDTIESVADVNAVIAFLEKSKEAD